MSIESINLEVLATRAGFNSAVKHMTKTIEISGNLASENLGDLLFERGDENLSGERGALLLRMLLVDKLGYKSVSVNLDSVASDLRALAKEFESWRAVDLVAAYQHPDLGLLIANPKNADELANFGMLRKRELLVIYAGKGDKPADESCLQAARVAIRLFQGLSVNTPVDLLKGNFVLKAIKNNKPEAQVVDHQAESGAEKKPAKAGSKQAAPRKNVRAAPPVLTAESPAISKGPVRMTPMYSVLVSNELFHNGNVEAWKRIIASYTAKYPELRVFIYYEAERILDINSLFKWGKVKHGSTIQFAVAGEDIKDVAKLQRYLVQGASSRFEAFLKGSSGGVLRLFG